MSNETSSPWHLSREVILRGDCRYVSRSHRSQQEVQSHVHVKVNSPQVEAILIYIFGNAFGREKHTKKGDVTVVV